MPRFGFSLCLLGAVSAAPLGDWREFGELMDKDKLAQPVVTDEEIAAHNARKGASWVAGRNPRFEGMTLKDVKRLMGVKRNTDESKNLPYKAPKIMDIPAEFDWRTDPRAKNCPSVLEVRDQSNCGSCWAFSGVEAITDRTCIATNGTKKPHLSAEDVTSCCKGGSEPGGQGDSGCDGGIPSDVYQYWVDNGIVDGGNYGDKSGCWSYQIAPCDHHAANSSNPCSGEAQTPKCAASGPLGKCPDNGASWYGSKHKGAEAYSVCSGTSAPDCEKAMMQDLYQNGPITVGFFVHKSLMSYKSGVYEPGFWLFDPLVGGHGVKLIGYGNEDGKPYWLIANSWNKHWGDNGFFKIIRGKNIGKIESPIINGGPCAGHLTSEVNSEVVV